MLEKKFKANPQYTQKDAVELAISVLQVGLVVQPFQPLQTWHDLGMAARGVRGGRHFLTNGLLTRPPMRFCAARAGRGPEGLRH